MAQIWQQNSALRSRYAQPTLMPTAQAVNTRVACEQLEQMARRLEAAQAEIRRYQTRLFACERQMIALRRENAELEAAGEQARAEAEQTAAREQALLTNRPIDALQYSITEGYVPLRNALKDYMKNKFNIGRDFDELIVTSGAQQVMDLATKSLVNEGDTVICEAPSFIGSLNSFRAYKARLCGIPLESDGMNLEALEKALKTEKNVRFIYTIPNFQNPSGVTTSLEKRHAIYELAKKYGVLILEDNPYGELRVSGEDVPAIKSFDEDGIVIYAGSFSKVLSPGMRIGWFVAPKEVAAKMIVCKQGSDVHTTPLPGDAQDLRGCVPVSF